MAFRVLKFAQCSRHIVLLMQRYSIKIRENYTIENKFEPSVLFTVVIGYRSKSARYNDNARASSQYNVCVMIETFSTSKTSTVRTNSGIHMVLSGLLEVFKKPNQMS